MNTPLSQLIPAIDISKPVAMAILPSTPMMPKSAALALWVGKPGDQTAALRWPSITPLSPPSVIGWWIRKRCITRRSAGTDRGLTAEGLPVCQQLAGGKYAVCSAARGRLRPAGGAALLLRADDQIGSAKSILLGIKNNQFYIVYQPVVNAQTLRISGVEVLMRWRHPVVGEIRPTFLLTRRNPADDRAANPSPARADRQRRCGVEAYSAARRSWG